MSFNLLHVQIEIILLIAPHLCSESLVKPPILVPLMIDNRIFGRDGLTRTLLNIRTTHRRLRTLALAVIHGIHALKLGDVAREKWRSSLRATLFTRDDARDPRILVSIKELASHIPVLTRDFFCTRVIRERKLRNFPVGVG